MMTRWLCVGLYLSFSMNAWAEMEATFSSSNDGLSGDGFVSGSFSDLGSYDGFFDHIPVVVTPSKMPQPRVDVSSTLSVLDGEFIRRINMQYVEDLLQFVPGFSVAPYKSSSQKEASYHGTQLDQYRRIQVLVNGRSVYSVGLARVEWATLPLSIEDVARVEINRGPNAASYGINSYFAVVNIITRSPLETLGDSITAYSGSRGDYRLYGQHSGLNDDWSYRASASTNNVSGFDKDADGDKRHDGHRSTMGNVFIQKETSNSFFDLDIGASSLKDKVEPMEYSLGSNLGGVDTNKPMRLVDREHIKASYSKQVSSTHELKIQYYYDQSDLDEYHEARLSRVFYNSAFGASGGSDDVDVSYLIDLLETRHDIELQSTWEASKKLRLISAIGYRWDEAESESFLSGKASDEVFRLSSNMEYLAGDRWVVNAGAMFERSQMGGKFLSPKFGVTYKLSEQESIRFNTSKAVRTPDLSDQYFKWHYVLSSGEESFTAYADKGEEEEKITSYEVGYYHYWPSEGLSLDVKLYHDEVQDMVLSQKKFTAYQADAPVEEGVVEDVNINGVELELDWRFRSGAITRFTYAYQDTQTDNASLKEATTPVMVSFFGSLPLTDRWTVQSYYWYGKEFGGNDYELLNAWFSYRLSLGGYSKATMGVGAETRLDDNALVSKHNNMTEDTFAYVFTNITF
ncbi:TonB-dependent receptor [Marinomonas sp. A3A]|uniref:TonB-dependent receptor plug domain-containing protein n=1 Tax=Marinomonas sp. A3A TaxID=2065312 RepID=UPI001BB374B5|nr:TonB-dependent receptor [Marinomonas sp. A3A]QUX92525.1 TonB-dependent receptor [Marinomonas sp. A3A]